MAARRAEGVQIERSADEILALKTESLEAHALNQSAAVVYDLCDGKTSTAEMYRVQAAAIQQDLARVGIRLEIRSQEFATLLTDVVKGNFQMYTAQFVGVTDPDMLRRVFHSAQAPPSGLNRAHYVNTDVDRLIDEASAMTDDEQRRLLYGQAQAAIARDVPVVSLWYKTNVAVAQARLTGITLSATADFAFLQHVGSASRGLQSPSELR